MIWMNLILLWNMSYYCKRKNRLIEKHISIEHKFRIECETLSQQIEALQQENALLLLQIVSDIILIKYIEINLGIYKKRK